METQDRDGKVTFPTGILGRRLASWCGTTLLVCALTLTLCGSVRADESGVAFWLSGQYASFAAVPAPPGWALAFIPYYYNGSASAAISFPRGGSLSLGLKTQAPLLLLSLSYAPPTKVLGGQPLFALAWGYGHNTTQADVSVTSLGTVFSRSETVYGGTDLYPTASIAWNHGVTNWMTYVTGGIPIGNYNSMRLANTGTGHGAIDVGGAYTYLNPESGREFSAVAGVTFNFMNPSTNYLNGVDSHLDVGFSQFVSASWAVGLAGFLYYQLGQDSGSGAQFGPFQSKVAAIGPQVSYFFTVGGKPWYANLRGYWEFWAENRVKGYSVFATLNIPIASVK